MSAPKILIGFCRGTALLSRIIEWFTGGPSHAFVLYWSDAFGGWLSVGAEATGWTTLPAESMEHVVSLYELPGVDLAQGLAANRLSLGAPYDIGGLLGMSWVMVAWRWLRRRVRNPLETRGAWFCSEICAAIIRDSGVLLSLAPGETDPGRLESEIVALRAEPVTDRAAYPITWEAP